MLENFEDLKKCSGNVPGLYREIERKEKIKILIRIGKYGWQEEFATKEDQRYIDALDFCWLYCVKISGNTPHCLFFKS
jgi:hypothetical protein